MTSSFGFLSKLEFLQDWASFFVAGINPAVVHNLEKYHALKKVHYLTTIENLEGDYLEFGVFTGSSLSHSIRCVRSLARINPNSMKTRFFGFDSFLGFGHLSEEDKHPFYTDENFSTNMSLVGNRVRRVAGKMQVQLIPGFFSELRNTSPSELGIYRAKVIFIDSDTYSSANDALTFCIPLLQDGTYIVLDDFFSYKGSELKGVCRAFFDLIQQSKITTRHVFNYGLGGAVYVVSES